MWDTLLKPIGQPCSGDSPAIQIIVIALCCPSKLCDTTLLLKELWTQDTETIKLVPLMVAPLAQALGCKEDLSFF